MKFEFHVPNKICIKELVQLLVDHEVLRDDESLFSNWFLDEQQSDVPQDYQMVLIGFANQKVLRVIVYLGTRLVVTYGDRDFKTFTCRDHVVDLEHNERAVLEQEVVELFEGIAICEKWTKGEVIR